VSAKNGEVNQKHALSVCATGDLKSDQSIRSAMTLIPFNQDSTADAQSKNASAKELQSNVGAESKSYSAAQLEKRCEPRGYFAVNPFSDSFKKSMLPSSQTEYETKQIKSIFLTSRTAIQTVRSQRSRDEDALRAPQGRRQIDRDQIAAETEKTRAPLLAAVKWRSCR